MKIFITLTLMSTLVISSCTSTSKSSTIDKDGFIHLDSSPLDQLAIRNQVSFSKYQFIKFEPITLSYSNKKRQYASSRDKKDYQLNAKEYDRFNQQVVKSISDKWNKDFGWEETKTASNNTLLVKIIISDFYLHAPIKNNQPLRYEVFANETSQFTVALELKDATSDQLLLSTIDKRTTGSRGSSNSDLQRFNSIEYWNDVYQEFSLLARSIASHIK